MPDARPPPDCLRCAIPMTPSSFSIIKPLLTLPGRSPYFGGCVRADVYVCSRCGRVEVAVRDPAAFARAGAGP